MKSKILRIILVMMIVVMSFGCNFNCNMVYADHATQTTDGGGGGGGFSNFGEGIPTIDGEGYKPVPILGGNSKLKINAILGALTVVGVIAILISITLIGFNTILGSAEEKADWQQKFTGVIIASSIITGGSIIARLIISVAESL